VTSTASLAAREHARLAYVERPSVPALLPAQATHPAYWAPLGKSGPPGSLSLGQTSGLLTGTVRVPAAGDYTVWLQGSLSRRVIVRIDDRAVGEIRHQIGIAGQSLKLATVQLAAGSHAVDILMPASYYAPGNVVSGQILGPLVLAHDDAPPAVHEVAPTAARSLCGKSLEWLEIVN
jgi:hypothetical protein